MPHLDSTLVLMTRSDGRSLGRGILALLLVVGICAATPRDASTAAAASPDSGVGGKARNQAAVVQQNADAEVGIAWHHCGERLQCARVRVPLDWDRPSGSKIELAVVRHLGTRPGARLGSLFVNGAERRAVRSS